MMEAQRRNSETIVAMGMAGALAQRWTAVNNRYIAAVGRLSDVAGLLRQRIEGTAALAAVGDPRPWRLSRHQSGVTAGAMIAASIMMGRALAPIETAIANWRGLSRPVKASHGCRRRLRAPRQSGRRPRCRSRRAVSTSSR